MPAAAKQPIPQGFHSVSPYMIVPHAVEAIKFYEKAFGAEAITRMEGPGGATVHAEMRIGDSRILMSDENLQWGAKSPNTLGGTPVSFHIYCDDADALFNQAVAAGCTAQIPPADMFWGDRYGKVQDPYGHVWAIATRKEDLTVDELHQRAGEAMREQMQPE